MNAVWIRMNEIFQRGRQSVKGGRSENFRGKLEKTFDVNVRVNVSDVWAFSFSKFVVSLLSFCIMQWLFHPRHYHMSCNFIMMLAHDLLPYKKCHWSAGTSIWRCMNSPRKLSHFGNCLNQSRYPWQPLDDLSQKSLAPRNCW